MTAIPRLGYASTMRPARLSPETLEHRLRRWAEVTELGLGLRGGMLLGRRRATWKERVRAGLAEANRRRSTQPGD
jgi:hypothetical protein